MSDLCDVWKEKEGEEKKKEEEMKEDGAQEIVLRVDMHCEGCAEAVARSLIGFEGVEEVKADCNTSKVVVKGKTTVDPEKLCRRIRQKSGRKAELISSLPNPSEETKDDGKDHKEEKKVEPRQPTTTVLRVRMHCEACAKALQKRIRRIQGVESVDTDIANDQVIVKGVVDPSTLVEHVYKRTRKRASIIYDEEKVEEKEKKIEEKKEDEKNVIEEEGNEDDEKKIEAEGFEY
ncbi:hypothetical protein Nepgr_028697 [Nepenthes gracilis]|uniref:HMA domain-containing protein n=1 Tax=Nepenthes gracilis TaxID=150966 RepID=A0AAD3TDE8_NEPGR|nr:hypothetical protein Nepgr_028697 [Nepenthes gracilis]